MLAHQGRTHRRHSIRRLEIGGGSGAHRGRRCLLTALVLEDLGRALRRLGVLAGRDEVALTGLVQEEGVGAVFARLTEITALERQGLAGHDHALVRDLGVGLRAELVHRKALFGNLLHLKLLEATGTERSVALIETWANALGLYGCLTGAIRRGHHAILDEARNALQARYVARWLSVRIKQWRLLPLAELRGTETDVVVQSVARCSVRHILFDGAAIERNHVVVGEVVGGHGKARQSRHDGATRVVDRRDLYTALVHAHLGGDGSGGFLWGHGAGKDEAAGIEIGLCCGRGGQRAA